jgi:hypothetical protein
MNVVNAAFYRAIGPAQSLDPTDHKRSKLHAADRKERNNTGNFESQAIAIWWYI